MRLAYSMFHSQRVGSHERNNWIYISCGPTSRVGTVRVLRRGNCVRVSGLRGVGV